MLDISRADLVAGVAGAGTMGRGIAQVLAQSGVRTLVFDAQPGAAQKARESIAQSLGKLVERGKLDAAAAAATVARIERVDSLQALAPCHVVVEAIIEDLRAKRELFAALEGIVGEDCILASNTSSLSVTAMAAACKRPQRVAGYHFFNPVPVMKIVEVVDGELTAREATDALTALARRFGHFPVRCKDTPGFVVNHAGRAFVPEALRVLSEGVADFASGLVLYNEALLVNSARSTPAFMRNPKIIASSTSCAGKSECAPMLARRPSLTSALHAPRSEALLPRNPALWLAADGPNPNHSPMRHVLMLCTHAWPGRAKFETSYCL